ncbi:MAG: hypothetical protein KAR87_03335 [Candidatus Aenigmarchaeota archaeon]|nr:hypothetical protein [Candidatus Aenigmarchaeota archaeon]
MILSVLFLFPIHADPYDFQRWTKSKWEKELKKAGLLIKHFEIMERYFTVTADGWKNLIKSMPRGLKLFFIYVTPYWTFWQD